MTKATADKDALFAIRTHQKIIEKIIEQILHDALREEPAKDALLEHYTKREPKWFFQFDAHDLGTDGGDDLMVPDGDGFCSMSTVTQELMLGCAVRVLIDPATTNERAIMGLQKLIEWISRGGLDSLREHLAELLADRN